MTPSIHTLLADIQFLLKQKGWMSDELSKDFANEVSLRLEGQFNSIRTPALSLSQMGPKCPRALWYSVNRPELSEELPPWAQFKFSFGHVIEALAISLAKAAGHSVVGEQDELVVDGVKGHRDCVIDGCIVDVKSSSSRGFAKFKDGSIAMDDQFGYLDQLDGYLVGSADDPLVTTKDVAYLLVIDKQLGHMCLYEHRLREKRIRERIAKYKAIVALNSPPKCECETIPDGASGNIRLGVTASYNPFKWECFPNLRCFLYSNGPRFLSRVVRQPDVTEVDRYGKIVYN